MADMEHSLSVHTHRLNSLCRICGSKSKSCKPKQKGVIRKCESMKETLASVFNINITEESQTKYSTTLCIVCYAKIYKLQKTNVGSEVVKANVSDLIEKASRIWTDFDHTVSMGDCKSCLTFVQQIPANLRTRLQGTQKQKPAVAVSHGSPSEAGGHGGHSQHSLQCTDPQTPEATPTPDSPERSTLTPSESGFTGEQSAERVNMAEIDEGSPSGCIDFPNDDFLFAGLSLSPVTLLLTTEVSNVDTEIAIEEQVTHTTVNEQVPYENSDVNEHENEHFDITETEESEVCSGVQSALNKQNESLSFSVTKECSEITVSGHNVHEHEVEQPNACTSLTHSDESSLFRPLSVSTPQKGISRKQACRLKSRKTMTPHTHTQKVRPTDEIKLPLTKEEQRCYEHMTRLLLKHSADQKSIRIKTRGQPILLRRVLHSRKSFTSLGGRQKRRRSKEVENYRWSACNQSAEENLEQFSKELNRLSSEHKDRVLKEAGVQEQAKLDESESLSMKTQFALSWKKMKEIRDVCQASGMKMPGEKSLKAFQKGVLCGEVEVQQINMQASSDTTPDTQANVAYIKDVEVFLTNVLDQYQKTNKLTWHNGKIPENEIWVKIGGDHGGGSFKFMLQVANLENANSRDNTWLLCLANVKDTYTNLANMFEHYKTQLENVSRMIWQGKSLKLFMFGDYEYLTKVYGLSGAQGKHPCLWCKATKEDVQIAASDYPLVPQRTLDGLKRDNSKFRKNKRKTKAIKAQAYYNAIHRPIFSIELDFVVPPYLHILLGIVKKHHTLLEKESHKLDLLIGKDLAKHPVDIPTPDKNRATPFEKYVQQMVKVHQLDVRCMKQNKIAFDSKVLLKTETDTHRRTELKDLLKTALQKGSDLNIKKLDLEEKAENELKVFDGPVTGNLDVVLARHNIVPQAYHSRAFVGNHCHKYIQPEVSADICMSVVEKTFELTESLTLADKAEEMARTFKSLNDSYFHVHRQISHAKPIEPDEIGQIEISIYQYMHHFRSSFPNARVIPKQHILEKHCVPFVSKFKLGLGLFGEHGGEACHATVNNLKPRVRGLKREGDRLAFLMTDMQTMTSPIIQAALPRKKQKLN